MREVISIDKNHVNNTTKEYKSLKPNGSLKGKVTVSLMDSNNNVVREVYTENAIMDITKYAQYLQYTQIGTNLASYIDERWLLNKLTDTFKVYKLSDDYEVNAGKPLLKFWDYNVIGTCGKKEEYSGSDTTKGTYNSAESKTFTDDETGDVVFHYVYDFPTHSCNGTINAIGFAPSNSPAIYGVARNNLNTGQVINLVRNGRVNNVLDVGIHTYAIITNSTGFVLKRQNKFSELIETIKTVTTKDTKEFQTYRFNTKKQNIVGILFTDKQNMLIQKFDLKGELISEENIPMTTLNGGTTFIKAILDDNEEYLYIYDYNAIKVYDIKNNYKEVINFLAHDEGETLYNSTTYTKYFTVHVDDNYLMLTYILNNGNRVRKYYNKKDYSLINKAYRTDNSIYYSTPITYNNNTTIVSSDYTYGYPTGNFVATLTKLPNPITKTNIHTMKVQYDIVYTPANIEDFI